MKFVRMIDEYIISRTMANKIIDKKFGIGGKEFQIVGKVK